MDGRPAIDVGAKSQGSSLRFIHGAYASSTTFASRERDNPFTGILSETSGVDKAVGALDGATVLRSLSAEDATHCVPIAPA
mmetsp:Transcript_123596/g.360937  ORF Transcript_123596/g.360937 Transcript_123596/m.360937 type:complete len:81 (+) Transcript_123596:858-1100(+)